MEDVDDDFKDVAEQITKKSVKLEMPARSSTTISSAFLFEASSAQVVANCFAVMSLIPGKDFRGEQFLPRPVVRDSGWSGRKQLGFGFQSPRCRCFVE